jgi:3-phenylpropionate/trans-cinnamate dioxygenase ferredoxin reductase subunit
MRTIIVVGGGHAAAEAVVALRTKGWEERIIMISNESTLPYHRPPLSKAYLVDAISADKLVLKKEAIYQKLNIEIMLNTEVVAIHAAQKQIELSYQSQIEYDKLIIATGTRPRLLPIPGAELSNVHYLRTVNDVNNIKAAISKGTKVLIVGAGYIGLEVAASLQKLGAKPTVLEAAGRVLARVTNAQMSDFYQTLHAAHGVAIKLNAALTKLSATEHGHIAELADGTQIEYDMAIIGIGVIPNSELAQVAGITCDNGILVNEYTQSSDPDVYAIGDVSNHPNPFYQRHVRLESVPNAMDQAKAAASHILGNPTAYDVLPWFWSDQYDIKLQTAGLSQGYDETVLRGDIDSHAFALFYLKEGELIAVDAINSPKDFMKAKQLIPTRFTPNKAKIANVSEDWFS